MRYRHCDGKLILKVTDDRVCLKFQTDQQTDVKKMERLNNLFFAHMCGEDPHDELPLVCMRLSRAYRLVNRNDESAKLSERARQLLKERY